MQRFHQIKIVATKNGNELVTLLEIENELPDFIFLDLNMPFKNGIECLQEIKKSVKWKHIKTVILSTSCNPEKKKELYKMGADLCLQKPNSFNILKDTLSKCLQMDWDTLK
ncbi:MAG: response regulator [Candidatus Methylacidiphilales bacterium]